MEDTVVIKGHYAYMFRVDLSCNQNSKLQIEEWLDYYSWSHWTGFHEIGKETGKHHYQMIVWRENKYSNSEQTKCRNWWRGKTNSKTHGAALASAKRVLNLGAYSTKNSENPLEFSTVNNLCSEQKKKIPKWETKTGLKKKNLEKLESTLKTVSKTLTKLEFCEEFNKIYSGIYGRPCMHRNTYIKYLYNHGYMKDHNVINYVFNLSSPYGQDIPGAQYIDIVKCKICDGLKHPHNDGCDCHVLYPDDKGYSPLNTTINEYSL